MADWVSNFIDPLIGGLPNIIQAVLLLIVALIAAGIARSIVRKIILKAMRKKAQGEDITEDSAREISDLLGNVVYAIIFLLFLPGALDKLGLTNVSAPIASMATTFLNFLPNIIAAVIVILFGAFFAKLTRQVLLRILKKTKLDEWQSKCGVESRPGAGFTDIIATLAYALILIIFIVAGLKILNITAISEPATAMVNKVFAIIPNIFAAVILVAVGAFIARLVGSVLNTFLAGTGMDKYVQEILPRKEGDKTCSVSASKVISMIVQIVINIFFIVTAIDLLGITVLSDIGTAIIKYMPQILAAALVLAGAWLLASWAEKAIIKASPKAEGLARGVHIFIIVIAGFMILSQLGIAPAIVNTLFLILAIGFAAAMAIAFGVGGRDWAKGILERKTKEIEEKMKKE